MAEQPMTQGFEQFITNLASAQSLKSLPNKGFCLYHGRENFGITSENGMLLPIRATEPRKLNIVSVSGVTISTNPYQGLKRQSCLPPSRHPQRYNFYESLSGIETSNAHRDNTRHKVTISTNPYQGL